VTTTGEIRIVPATRAIWDDVVAVFGTKGDPSRCWCQWFRMRNADWKHATTAANREALKEQVVGSERDPAPGLIAYVDGEPAGWCAVAPRAGYPRLETSLVMKTLARTVDGDEFADPRVWSITCFVVRVNARRNGLAGELVRSAVDFARDHGADIVEGYPVDIDRKSSVSSSELYHGALSMFVDAGFEVVAGQGDARPVVRLELRG
jgi:ribosomal protein S18 acetylase RimI-like enzyme